MPHTLASRQGARELNPNDRGAARRKWGSACRTAAITGRLRSAAGPGKERVGGFLGTGECGIKGLHGYRQIRAVVAQPRPERQQPDQRKPLDLERSGDRKSVEEGKGVSVRVDHGGRRRNKKKNTHEIERNERQTK